MKFKFENLIIWQKAMDLGENIDKLSDKFPKKEMYNLSSQIRRAADSIALNTRLPDGQVSEDQLANLIRNLKSLWVMQSDRWLRWLLVFTKPKDDSIYQNKNSINIMMTRSN